MRRETWQEAHDRIEALVYADPQFRALVAAGGNPDRDIPTPRQRRIARLICERLGLVRAVWIGNVYGAAAKAGRARRLTP